MTRVVGLDLSLTSTGVAEPRSVWTAGSRLSGVARLAELRDALLAPCRMADLVAIEQYAFRGRDAHAHELGELGGVVRLALWEHRISFIDVPITVNKRFATGKGNAGKEAMLIAAVKRGTAIDVEVTNNNEADAFWLRAAVHEAIGEPLFPMPTLNRSAVRALAVELGVAA